MTKSLTNPAEPFDTLARLAREHDERDRSLWQPTIWPAVSLTADHPLLELVRRGDVVVHDQLIASLRELADTRHPRRPPLSTAELDAAVDEFLAHVPPSHYGNWVYYPWLRRAVHVLPRDEFRELRTSRNRNKITADEQRQLQALDLAIVGLSVGRATALTLALEGLGDHFRLADFDELSLSNMNRLRSSVHEIGLNKSVMTARALFEIDPYLRVSLWPDGLDTDNLDAFLSEGRTVDLLFEECDDLEMKVRVREAARRLRIPVLMETSDRGMLDIERFDLEPEREFFHGLAGKLDADALRGLDTYAKVPTVAAILGLSTLSRRMAASLIDVDATIKTWPQLASAVALGGALNTDAARRLVLGELRESGRYYADLDELIRDGAAVDRKVDARESTPPTGDAPTPRPLPELVRSPGPVRPAELEALVAWATRAPSGGNSQPWRFQLGYDSVTCHVDPERAQTVLDDGLLAAHVACGAALEHLVIAAPSLGLRAEIDLPRDVGPSAPFAWRVRLTRVPETDLELDPLVGQIGRRCTNRKRGPRTPLATAAAVQLQAEAATAGATLELVRDPAGLETLALAIARAERQRLLCARLHRDMFSEIRWTDRETSTTRDGLDVRTLELDPTERAGMTLLRSWTVMDTLRSVGGGLGLERPTREAVRTASAMGSITVDRGGPEGYLLAGRSLARIWLRASALGLSFQPMTAVLFLIAHLECGTRTDIDPGSVRVFEETAESINRVFGPTGRKTRTMLFRLAQTPRPSARSLRRDIADVVSPTR